MTDETIDRSALQRLLEVIGGDQEDLQELIDDFEDSAPEMLESLRTAGSAGDWASLRVSAHSLKSNGRDFGAMRLAALCETLEHQCREGAVDDAEGQIAGIAAELDRARAWLGTYKAGQ